MKGSARGGACIGNHRVRRWGRGRSRELASRIAGNHQIIGRETKRNERGVLRVGVDISRRARGELGKPANEVLRLRLTAGTSVYLLCTWRTFKMLISGLDCTDPRRTPNTKSMG